MNRLALSLLATALLSGPALAGPEDDIKKKVGTLLGGMKIESVQKAPVGGLYEVVFGQGNKTGILYTDEKTTYLMIGRLVDTDGMKDLTSPRMQEIEESRRVDFDSLPKDFAFKVVKGDGKRQVAVFSDIDCPFCVRLEKELEKVDNVTIWVYLFPLEQLHPQAPAKSNAIWCSKDPAATWQEVMLAGKKLDTAEVKGCAAPLADVAALAAELGIQGTPGLVFGSGRVVPGFIPAERLETFLDETAKKPGKKPAAD